MFDLYKVFWGVIKFALPIMFFIISVFINHDVLLLIVAILWLFAAVIETVLTMNPDKSTGLEQKY